MGAPLANHLTAYLDHLDTATTNRVHRENCRRYLDRLSRECGQSRLADATRDALESWLATRAREEMFARSRNAHRNTLVPFCNWCLDTGRLTVNPVDRVRRANKKADPRRRRRAMTEDEQRRLLEAARNRPIEDRLRIRRGKKNNDPTRS